MYVRHLSVADFRSWAERRRRVRARAVRCWSGRTGRARPTWSRRSATSPRSAATGSPTDAPLVRAGAERAVVRAAVVADDRELRVEVEITPGRANRAKLNGAPLPRPREMLGVLRVVLFAPEDLAIVRGDPSERRRFLDELLVARAPAAGRRARRLRAGAQAAGRAAEVGRRGPPPGAAADLRTLDVWDGHLAAHGAQLLRGPARGRARAAPARRGRLRPGRAGQRAR